MPQDLLDPDSRAAVSRVIAVDAPKGGVGKSSFAATIAGLIAAQGHRVLLVTTDHQDDAGEELGYHLRDQEDDGRALAHALRDQVGVVPSIRDVRSNLDVVCGGRALVHYAKKLSGQDYDGTLDLTLLARVLAPTAAQYSFVVIDCAPGEDTLRKLVLNAAKWVLIPTTIDKSSQKNVERLAERFAEARETNPGLMLLGVALFRIAASHSRIRRETAEVMGEVLEGSGAPVFESIIRDATNASRAVREFGQLPHELVKQRSRAGFRSLIPVNTADLAKDYVSLTKEILARIAKYEKDH